MNLTANEEMNLEYLNAKFLFPQNRNLNERSKQEELKKSIKLALSLKSKVDDSEKEENKKCLCGGIYYRGIYNFKEILVCNICHRAKFYKSTIKESNFSNTNKRKIIFKDIQIENKKVYKKPLVKLGLDLSKSMIKENSPLKNLSRNKNNLLNSTDLSFRILLKNYYNTVENINENRKNEDENDIENKVKKNIYEFSSDLNINEYKILNLIGSGSFANIYIVENYKSKIQYAVKKIITDGNYELDKIKNEIEIIKSLSELNSDNKKYFIPIYKYSIKKLDNTSYSIYFLMSLAVSDWGKEIEKKDKFYSENFLLNLLKHLAAGLSLMQHKNIVHRDIKPQNILIMENKNYLICDFDESIFVKRAYGSYDVRGTEMFICPILQNCIYSGMKKAKINIYKSDIYSLGLCFVYAITKNFEVIKKIKKNHDDFLNKNIIINNIAGNKKLSDNFIEILMKMIAYNEKDRLDCIELDKLLNHNNENI